MAKCIMCGSKVGFFADETNRYEIYAEIRDFFLKEKLLSFDECKYFTERAFYCEDCQRKLNQIKFGDNYEKAYSVLKNKIMSRGFILFPWADAKCFAAYVDHLYKIRKNKEEVIQTKKDIRLLLNTRWKSLEQKYQTTGFVFPKQSKHSHVCATRDNENFVLIENSRPKLKLGNLINKNHWISIFEDFKNLDDKTIFAISIIPLRNILSYQSTGYVEHATKVSGGGGYGGGVNKKGAIVGGLLFGGAGAIVGSQMGTELFINPITSNIVEYDYRKTILNLKNELGQVEIKELPYYYGEVFQKVIPEKEFNFLQANKNTEPQIPASVSNINMLEEMKQLKELLDIGLITQEEFNAKRIQILKL